MRWTGPLVAICAIATSCSPPEPVSRDQAQFTVRGRWPDSAGTISYSVETHTSPIDAAICARAIGRAAKIWNETGTVRFQPAAAGRDPDLVIGWRRGHHGACIPFGPGADVAHAGPVKPGTFIHFDLARKWDEESVFGTAVHELGHVIGLGHSEAPDAVMSTSPERPTALSMHDLAGLHSLYGGGQTWYGDLGIGSAVIARRIAPWPTCRFSVFDTDGDGDSEIVVWRIDEAGHGALRTYHFESGEVVPRLERTLGPFHGTVAPGAEVRFVRSEAGDRLLVCRFDNGRTIVRQFDQHGIPGQPATPPSPELLERAEKSHFGDLDGDGRPELVMRTPVTGL